MATIMPMFTKIRGPAGGIDAVVATWAGLTSSGDVGAALQRLDLVDRSVQMYGTWGGGTVVWEGSNDGVNYSTLNNPFGAAISLSANGLMQVTEATAWVRPHCTADTAGVTVTVTMRRTMRGG